jgi:hypothetical protein
VEFKCETRRDISKRKSEVKLRVTYQKMINRRVKWEGNDMQWLCVEEDGFGC